MGHHWLTSALACSWDLMVFRHSDDPRQPTTTIRDSTHKFVAHPISSAIKSASHAPWKGAGSQGPPQNNIYTLARAPRGRMLGGATQAMPLCIVEERQQRRRPLAAAPLRAAARRPAGCVARSLHTATGMLVAHALPAGLGACSKV